MRPIYLFSISSHPDTVSINSLEITFLQPNIDFSLYDYLIITSKQASKALQHYNLADFIDIPALCISKESAKSYKELGGEILATGEGYGDTLVETIKKYPKEKRWLYLRAKIIASDFVLQCRAEGCLIDEAVVYESGCSQDILTCEVKEEAVLIFTSPSSLKCFLKTHTLSKRSHVIVIGKTTAKAVPAGIKYHISEKTTIESCIALAKNL